MPEISSGTEGEKQDAEARALEYKNQVVQEYFQSKRERMAGGKGRLVADSTVKTYMKELNIVDIDDFTRLQQQVLIPK